MLLSDSVDPVGCWFWFFWKKKKEKNPNPNPNNQTQKNPNKLKEFSVMKEKQIIKQFCKEKLYIDHANLGWFIVEYTAAF